MIVPVALDLIHQARQGSPEPLVVLLIYVLVGVAIYLRGPNVRSNGA